MNIRGLIKRIPLIGKAATYIYIRCRRFPGTLNYWERRYSSGEDSGAGSRGRLAAFKADIINSFVQENKIGSVVDYGCGDGSQLCLANYPTYTGLDVSHKAIEMCKNRFAPDNSKQFYILDPKSYQNNLDIPQCDLALSLDVIYHLVEDEVFHQYMSVLFNSSNKYIIIYSSNLYEPHRYHIKPRQFTKWIEKHATDWELIHKIDNPYPYDSSNPDSTSKSDFYIFKKLTELCHPVC